MLSLFSHVFSPLLRIVTLIMLYHRSRSQSKLHGDMLNGVSQYRIQINIHLFILAKGFKGQKKAGALSRPPFIGYYVY